jgi:hypothetical protein
MTITRRDLLAGIGSGTAIALPVALKGQRPGPFSAVGAFAGLFGPIDGRSMQLLRGPSTFPEHGELRKTPRTLARMPVGTARVPFQNPLSK